MHSIGVDIGGTAIKAGRVDAKGHVVEATTRTSSANNPDAIVASVLDTISELSAGCEVSSVGVAVAAFLDPSRENVLLSPNISWENRPLKHELQQALGVDVVIENDANAAALGEYFAGAGEQTGSMVMLTLGTGVGGGIVDHGQIRVGARGIAGELGHIIAQPGGPRCGCGQYGCLEALASATAFVRELKAHTGNSALTTAEVGSELAAHPELAKKLFAQAAAALAASIVSLQAVLDPDRVVLGGGLMDRAGDQLLGQVHAELAHLTRDRRSDAFPEVRVATLGNQAGVIGAALASRAGHSKAH